MSKLVKRRSVTVFDNGGRTFDRYSIINRKTGDVYGASPTPTHPQGFGLFSHNVAEEYWCVAYGYSWRKFCDVKKCIKFAVDRYMSDTNFLGPKVKLIDLPEEVINFIDKILED